MFLGLQKKKKSKKIKNNKFANYTADNEIAKFTAQWNLNSEKMTNSESLSTFYNRFKLRYEACNTLGVASFEDELELIVRQFYVKLDGPRYATYIVIN